MKRQSVTSNATVKTKLIVVENSVVYIGKMTLCLLCDQRNHLGILHPNSEPRRNSDDRTLATALSSERF
jgi:hypothetical protein